MKHSRVILISIVAKCLFQVYGLPAGGQTNEPLHNVKKLFCCGKDKEEEGISIFGGPLSTGFPYGSEINLRQDRSVTGFGPGKEYTVETLSEALASVTPESLREALDLDISKKGSKNVDILNVFTKFIIGQSQNPPNGIINYETAIIFLERFNELAPETRAAMKTISNIMMGVKQQHNEGAPVDINSLILPALNDFYGKQNINTETRHTWLNLAPYVLEATQGNADAAKKIVTFLASQIKDLRTLKSIQPKKQLDILKLIIEQTIEYPKRLSRV